jgi:hypothetical protein
MSDRQSHTADALPPALAERTEGGNVLDPAAAASPEAPLPPEEPVVAAAQASDEPMHGEIHLWLCSRVEELQDERGDQDTAWQQFLRFLRGQRRPKMP